MTGMLVALLGSVRRHPFWAALAALVFWGVGALLVDWAIGELEPQLAAFIGGLLGLPLTGVVLVAVLGHLEAESWSTVVQARRRNSFKTLAKVAWTASALLDAPIPEPLSLASGNVFRIVDGVLVPKVRPDGPVLLAAESDEYRGSVVAVTQLRRKVLRPLHATVANSTLPDTDVTRDVEELRTRLAEFIDRARAAGYVPEDADERATPNPIEGHARQVKQLPAWQELDRRSGRAVAELIGLMERSQDSGEVAVLDTLVGAARDAADNVAAMVAVAQYTHNWLWVVGILTDSRR